MAGPGPLIWLCAGEPDRHEPLRVLAAQLAELPVGPSLRLGAPAEFADPSLSPRADLVVLAGDVIPVAMVETAAARGIPVFWIGAGPSPRLDRRGLLPGRLRRVLSGFSEIHARDDEAASALTRLLRGQVAVHPTGQPARLPAAGSCNISELEALREALAARPVWFAYSLPEAEFAAALAAHAVALRQAHRLLMIAAPREARDGAPLTERARERGFQTARRQTDDEIDEGTQIYIADAEDDPGLFLRLAPVTFLGGSLTKGAGSPPPEPAAALGTALVFGPAAGSTFLDRLRATGGGRKIARPEGLGPALAALLAPEVGAAAALQAWTLASEGSDVTWALARAIGDWLALNPRGMAT